MPPPLKLSNLLCAGLESSSGDPKSSLLKLNPNPNRKGEMKEKAMDRKLQTAYSNKERLLPREVREQARQPLPKSPAFAPQTLQYLSSR